MTRGIRLLAVVVAASAGAGACDSGDGGSRSPIRSLAAPPPVAVVEIGLADHRFEYEAGAIPAGRVVFRARNVGDVAHNLLLVRLPEDLPPIEVQLRGSQRRLVEPFAGFYDRPPGDTGTFAVDLASGTRYAMICSVMDPDGQPHSQKGMVTEFRTPAGPPTSGPAAGP